MNFTACETRLQVAAFNRCDGQPVGKLDASNQSEAFKVITQAAA